MSTRLPLVNASPRFAPLPERLWLAVVCFFRVLFDGIFAARAQALLLPAHAEAAPAPEAAPPAAERSEPAPQTHSLPPVDAALQLLGLLQREGRLIDFLQQDVSAFPDADIGAAARVVHDGCRKALAAHLEIRPVRDEREGAGITLESVDPNAIKLVGNVSGTAPFRGTLRHRGWRALSVRLPAAVAGFDPNVLAPAEVEL